MESQSGFFKIDTAWSLKYVFEPFILSFAPLSSLLSFQLLRVLNHLHLLMVYTQEQPGKVI